MTSMNEKPWFNSLPNRAQTKFNNLTCHTQQEALDWLNAGSKAHSYLVKNKSGVFADKFHITIIPYKMYYNNNRIQRKIEKEFVLTASKYFNIFHTLKITL